MIRRTSALAMLVPVVLLALCGCANRRAAVTPPPTVSVEPTSCITTGTVDDLTLTMRTPCTMQATTRDEYSLTLTNGSDQPETVRPFDWLVYSMAVDHRCASVHSAHAWLKRKDEAVSLRPGSSLEITYSVMFVEPGNYNVGPDVPAGYVEQDRPTATVAVD